MVAQMVKNLPSDAGDSGLTPGLGTKIPHASGQRSPPATTTKPTCHKLERSSCAAMEKIPRLQLRSDAVKNK